MNPVDYKKLVSVGAIIGIVVIVTLAFAKNITLGLNFDTLGLAGTAATLDWILWGIFREKLWKLKILHSWLVLIPNLGGKWHGTLRWKDATTNEFHKKEVLLLIKQTLTRITLDMKTDEMKSKSSSASIFYDGHRNEVGVEYTYESTPETLIRERNPIHYGTTHLEYKNGELVGEYWTSRRTIGEIKLIR
ncbi:Cap15 family cyclic dinucleotide receptor domain-containing protein [Lactococcus garvieae]|uniref:Cap15 family cyclic dinucleotide receptor domain-containing protein n=1 Tax=Lactococcus garvieae TaxID=1363 RepID=UPI003854022F